MNLYLDYDQAELDRAYTQTAWAPNAEEIIRGYGTKSAAVRERLSHRANVSYGESAAEVLDFFPTNRPKAPICVFVHGGAWTLLTKDESAFAAEVFVEAGVHFVAINFACVPQVRLPEMVAQVRRATAFVRRHAENFGADPQRLFMLGHSSGAHLVAAALTEPSAALGGNGDAVVRGALCASGSYDLEPVMLSHRGSYLKLDDAEVEALSPLHHVRNLSCPLKIAYGERESPEFQRQAKSFAQALASVGRLDELLIAPGLNHFEISMTLAECDGLLARAALEMIDGLA
ncbi:MAG: alpha/beta hydrolase [Hyphomicrobiales bacterium]|nr:alpha/beta hydrolase [Hyphomicrobiales bacterium]